VDDPDDELDSEDEDDHSLEDDSSETGADQAAVVL